MKEDIYNYIKLGINHHLLNFKCFQDYKYHLKTLPFVLNHPAFQIVDLFVVKDDGIREREIELIKASGKEIIYNGAFMLPDTKYNPHSLIEAEREEIFRLLKQQADLAIEVRASMFVIVSNFIPEKNQREEAKEGFSRFLSDFASYIRERSDMKVVLEPGDGNIDKRFLCGPTKESAEVVRKVRQKGTINLGLMIDMSHLPLLGESFEEAVEAAGDLLWHVHLGSCIIKDKTHPLYGDKHPPLGLEGGEHGVEELAGFLKELLKSAYLNKEERKPVTLEVRPALGSTAQETLSDQIQVLREAWYLTNEPD